MKRKQPLARRRERGREREEEKQMKRLSEGNESDGERVGDPGWGRGVGVGWTHRVRPLGNTPGRFPESLRMNQVPWPAWCPFLSGLSPHPGGQEGPTWAGPPNRPRVSELFLFKLGHDSAVLGPRAAGSLRLLQALLSQLGQVLLWWEERDTGGRKRVSGGLAGQDRTGVDGVCLASSPVTPSGG